MQTQLTGPISNFSQRRLPILRKLVERTERNAASVKTHVAASAEAYVEAAGCVRCGGGTGATVGTRCLNLAFGGGGCQSACHQDSAQRSEQKLQRPRQGLKNLVGAGTDSNFEAVAAVASPYVHGRPQSNANCPAKQRHALSLATPRFLRIRRRTQHAELFKAQSSSRSSEAGALLKLTCH